MTRLFVIVVSLLTLSVPAASWVLLRSSEPRAAPSPRALAHERRAARVASAAPRRAAPEADPAKASRGEPVAAVLVSPASARRGQGAESRVNPAPAGERRTELVAEPGEREGLERAESRLRAVLESIRADSPNLDVAFTRCDETACVARVESRLPSEVDRFVAAAKQSPLGLDTRVRERLSAFNGRMFQADIRAATESVR